ncbi:MAG: MTH938/NDUFAF3 family protein [Pseudomonadota bacterium]
MDLTLHNAPPNAIRSLSDDGVIIGQQHYTQSLLVSGQQLNAEWSVTDAAQLDRDQARMMLDWQPELVILGTGATLTFPPPPFAASIMAAHVGLESMHNAAACRTFNILLDEGRAAMLALIFPVT